MKLLTKKYALGALASCILVSFGANAGFSVSSGKIYEENGNEFIMRGINHAHNWFPDKLEQSINDIATTGANTVRVVLSNGDKWTRNSASDVANVIEKVKAAQMIAVLEVHDTTGYSEDTSATSLQSAVDYWLTLASVLQGQEDYVFINIGNEPFGNNFNHSDWINAHKTAIQRLRNAGFNHTLRIDAPDWGQDWEHVMRDNAETVFQSDANKNVVFSIHMYEVFDTRATINDYLTQFSNKGIPLVIGEFAATHKEYNVDEGSIMSLAASYGVGYLGWSWDGNDASFGEIDIVNNWSSSALTAWGEILINGGDGIRATSKLASIYTGTTTGTTETPVCASADSDPDGDGWGWENNQSCVVAAPADNTSPESTPTNSTPTCASADSDPDGDGWGWENNQSCIVEAQSNSTPTCASADSDPDGDGWGWENNQSCIVQ